jgi:hypothetical protein
VTSGAGRFDDDDIIGVRRRDVSGPHTWIGVAISFASLFVGLVLGIVDVRLLAGSGVERVGLFLDGRKVAEMREPFAAAVDLGCEPEPHELVAVAYDASGREVGRARQWLNRPRAAAEATLALEPGRGGRGPVARLTWRSLVADQPEAVTVTLDGAPVEVHDPSRVELPPLEPAGTHFLRAALDFGRGVSASAELVFGGGTPVDAEAELTAVAIEAEKGAELPEAEGLAGWLEAGGAPLRVVAVESPGADVVFVAEESTREGLRRAYERVSRAGCALSNPQGSFARAEAEEDVRLRFLWPLATTTPQGEVVANAYPTTRWFGRGRSSLDWIAGCRLEWPARGREAQRIADAVAVAGLAAVEGGRRRAVVLLLGPTATDASRLSPDEAIRFLGRLGVPLRVVSVGGGPSPEAARWRAARPAVIGRGLAGELGMLLDRLERQRIAWVEGAHLPQAVSLGPLAKGIRLVR